MRPDNLCLDSLRPDAAIKLIDFGFATPCAAGEVLTSPCGTFEFMAVEMLHDGGYSFPVDVWACGITFYAICTGRFPRVASYCAEYIKKGRHKEVKVSAVAQLVLHSTLATGRQTQLLRRLLEARAEKRITAATALEDLQALSW